MKPYKVPSLFEDEGITGDLLLSLTLDKYKEITQEVFRNEDFTDLLDKDLDMSTKIERSGSIGANFNSVVDIIRKEFGIPGNEINIDVTSYPESYKIYLKLPDKLYRKINIKKDQDKTFENYVNEITEKVAFEFIMDQNPEILIDYLQRINYNLEDFESYVYSILDNKETDKVAIYIAWASRLQSDLKMEKGYRKIIEALEIDSTEAKIWSALANYHWGLGELEMSYELMQKAIAIDSTDGQVYSYLAQYYAFRKEDYDQGLRYLDLHLQYSETRDRGYYLKGILFANMELPDSITKYIELMNKESYSPEREADIWASYYGKIGDLQSLIKYAQRGIDYGLAVGNYLSEPPYSDYLDNPDFVAFLEKNNIPLP